MKLILSSCDFRNDNAKKTIIDNLSKPIDQCKLLFIPNEKATYEAIHSEKYFLRMQEFGFTRDNIAVFDYYDAQQFINLDLDIIYISGGNTFATLKRIKDCGFDKEIIRYVKSGVLYIGGSAGAHIATQSIEHIAAFDSIPDGMNEFKGLGLFDGILICHYTAERKRLLDDLISNSKYSDNSVIDVAFDSHYQSHEGYTRSFVKRFSITPKEYRKRQIAIPIFTQHPANHYYILKEGQAMDTTTICTVTPVNRPKRKLIYLTSKSATDYLSYCEEVGCDWEGLLNSIHEKFDTAALIDLPDSLQQKGISKIAAGVEVPIDYKKTLPDGYEVAELPECVMLYFQSEPYDNPDDFGKYIGQVFKAIENYNFERYGYKYATSIAPTLNLGAEPEIGARIAIPVESIK